MCQGSSLRSAPQFCCQLNIIFNKTLVTKWLCEIIIIFVASDLDEGPHVKRVKEHKVNRKPSGMGKMLGLGELGDIGGNNNEYKEDTRLEDRLAMEAEEEKKYETGEGYGTGGGGAGGGGGGGGGWEDGGKGVNWATNIQRQDAAEVKMTMSKMPH